MRNIKMLFLIPVALFISLQFAAAQTASGPDTGPMGAVRSADGKALEGVGVSARASGQTFTTTVYTDLQGRYSFPALDSGHYQIFAQAVGFTLNKADLDLAPGRRAQQNFTMSPFKDISKQLSGAEWMAALPEDTPQDRRLKNILHHQCNTCHVSSFMLLNRFDASGWRMMVNFMERTTPYVDQRPNVNQAMNTYKEEVVGYLTQIRGPNPMALQFKPFPRPTGEAAQVIVTEYDISPGYRPGYISPHNGTDWSEGFPSRHEARALHSIKMGPDGAIWFSDTYVPGRTLSKLDPRTGKVTDYVLADRNNEASGTHGLTVDQEGNVWLTNNAAGALTRFDTKTEKFQVFPRPDGMRPVGSDIRVDSKGNPWALHSNPDGIVKLDPKTGKYTDYLASKSGGAPYGVAVDAKDNAWFTQINGDRIVFVDAQTDKVGEIVLDPLTDDLTDRDHDNVTRLAGLSGSSTDSHAFQKGPRRMAADLNGDTLWVAEYWGNRLAKIDINSKKLVKEYRVPWPQALPYAVAVDKNHMVYVTLMNMDRIAKFNPFTEQFTELPLPSLGSGNRSIDVDNRTDPPTIWVPEFGTNKIARVQVRPAAGAGSQLAADGR